LRDDKDGDRRTGAESGLLLAGVKASYYFCIVKKSYDEDIIRQIAEMGHEML